MAEGIQIKNLPSTTTIKQGDTMTIVQDKQNKQLTLDRFTNKSDLGTLSVLENRCDEVKAKIEVDEYSAEITTSQSMSEIGSDDSGANLHENVLDGAFESCVLKGHTKYRDIDTGEILENFEESRNLELITVRMPILTTTGKNLWNDNWSKGLTSSSGVVQTGGTYDGFRYNEDLISTKPLSTLYFKSFAPLNGMLEGARVAEFGVNKEFLKMNSGGKSFTLSENTYFIRVHFDLRYNNGVSSQANPSDDVLTFGMVSTSPFTDYEPYKTSILSLPEEVVLRSLPDGTCDTLNVETGEYVQKIGERSYQNGDTNSNTLVTDGTKTHYKLSSPIITKVDVQGFPHAYKNGHIQLSSGSTEPSLTPTVTYKVPVSRVGQIASNTKSNLRQTIKLDQLEILAYQSLINAEYENLLVQNSAESAASFTNLSTNDPKDELYYMLKHLIEEDQPVQNMLDKINLFYLYGLLNDEHYFDLLLGGEEDVY